MDSEFFLSPSNCRRRRSPTPTREELTFLPLPSFSVGPATYKSFHGLQAPLPTGAGVSRDEAARIIQAERDNLEIISEIIEKEGIAETVDFWRGHLCESKYFLSFPLKQRDGRGRYLTDRFVRNLSSSSSLGEGQAPEEEGDVRGLAEC